MTDVKPRGGHCSSWPVKQRIMTAVWVKQETSFCWGEGDCEHAGCYGSMGQWKNTAF